MLYPLAFQPETLSSLELITALQGLGEAVKERERMNPTSDCGVLILGPPTFVLCVLPNPFT